jgi:hypothetical protein
METRTPAARYSTREIALRLFQSERRTREFLFLLEVPHTKAGNSYLWDAETVDATLTRLQVKRDTATPARPASLSGGA